MSDVGFNFLKFYMFSLKDKKAVITGGGSGIGKAIAVLFAQQGAEVHVIELTAESAGAAVFHAPRFSASR